VSQADTHLKDILLSLVWWYREEYDLLQILSDGDEAFVYSYLSQNPDSMLQFAKYGILREGGAGFAIDDLRDFLREFGESYKQEISPFKRSDIMPDILPDVPDLELLSKLYEKRVSLEISLRRIIELNLGTAFGWDAGKMSSAMSKGIQRNTIRQDPSSLFVGRTPKNAINDLFILDLKGIIKENWQIFQTVFENNQIRFEMNMDMVNEARRYDAHS
jgi:hypothetical protein